MHSVYRLVHARSTWRFRFWIEGIVIDLLLSRRERRSGGYFLRNAFTIPNRAAHLPYILYVYSTLDRWRVKNGGRFWEDIFRVFFIDELVLTTYDTIAGQRKPSLPSRSTFPYRNTSNGSEIPFDSWNVYCTGDHLSGLLHSIDIDGRSSPTWSSIASAEGYRHIIMPGHS